VIVFFLEAVMFGIRKEIWVTAGVALAAFAVIAFIQRSVFAIPVVGAYLPK